MAEDTQKTKRRPRRKRGRPAEITERVDAVMDQGRVTLFPIKHFSPACAHHAGALIGELRPACVMVEGPEDATDLIPFIVHPGTSPPLTLFSFYLDKRNKFGLNGVLSASAATPTRFRGWWPLTAHSPEYEALRAGHAVGADLRFIDVPLHVTIPYHHVRKRQTERTIGDRHLAENRYFDALSKKQRRRSFGEFWNANFEVGGLSAERARFIRMLLTFAACARESGDSTEALEADGTLVREAHMRYRIDEWLKDNPTGDLLVLTGAFHSVALPWTKRKKAKVRADANLKTMVTVHSFRALSSLYQLNQSPGYSQAVWDEVRTGSPEPYNQAASRLLLEVMRDARARGEAVSTADAVGAYKVARNLARLRRNREVTLEDLSDAVEMSYVKGDSRFRGGLIRRILAETLVGSAMGRVTLEAGQPPLIADFYQQAKANRIDISGQAKTVRCDIHKLETHRLKSAFLHTCDTLDIPIFGRLDPTRGRRGSPVTTGHYKGPDIATGENLHLITETWGIKWTEQVDDRLIELSDRGASLGRVAESVLEEERVKAEGNAADTTRLLLRSAQMMLLDAFDTLLGAVEDAIVRDSNFDNLVAALHSFTVLYSYRDAVASHGRQRLTGTVEALFVRATLLVPSLAGTEDDATATVLASLQTLVRTAITFDAAELDQELLTNKLQQLVARPDGNAAIRGAGYGVLYSLGATREKIVSRELSGYLLGGPQQALEAGPFLEGLFLTAKNIVLGSPRLLRTINDVLSRIDWETFKRLLPELRRAFTNFIPSEIDDLSAKVSCELGLSAQPGHTEAPNSATVRQCALADARIRRALSAWKEAP